MERIRINHNGQEMGEWNVDHFHYPTGREVLSVVETSWGEKVEVWYTEFDDDDTVDMPETDPAVWE